MSMLNRPVTGNDLGEVIASTRDYEAAQKTVSKLIAGEVPARDIAIVGEGVRTVERVTGRLGYAAAARSGAINGVLIGLLLSAIMLFGNPEAPITLFLGFLLVGVALGMIMSLITYAIVRRRRDFASVSQMIADHYEVRVQAASLAKARQVVGHVRPASTRPPVDLSEPPRYGERITPDGAQGAGAPAAGSQSSGSQSTPHVAAPAPHTAPPPPPPLPAPVAESDAGAGSASGSESDASDGASSDAAAGGDASDAGDGVSGQQTSDR
ncbi:general stress protein [Microbacterium esteraromaticum]|uniref:general stress protein n=1 Tax=Microbacterium esteraromaticum TaxID=57043 RepID=UPI001F5C8902|nr:general stress protein [Microbacterium esteraromaticum]